MIGAIREKHSDSGGNVERARDGTGCNFKYTSQRRVSDMVTCIKTNVRAMQVSRGKAFEIEHTICGKDLWQKMPAIFRAWKEGSCE